MKKLPEMTAKAGYDPPWFHSGGLSNEMFFQGGRALGARPDLAGSNEGLDWAHRIWWWRRCLDSFDPDTLSGLQDDYRRRMRLAMIEMDVQSEVSAWTNDLLPWITWDG